NEGYMYELIDVYFNPTMDNYIDVRIHKEALTKSGYTLKYEVCNYEKEINITDDPIEDFTTSVPIPIDEYERIVEANINKFDNDRYMNELIDVYFNPTMDNYIDVRIHKEALTKSGYTLKYEVCNYEKEINITDDPIEDFTTSVPIPIDEYERIVEANINKFDNDMNNPANVSSLLIIKS